MNKGVKIESAVNVNQILGALTRYHAVGVIVAAAAGVAENGKKVVKAGTPLAGDLLDRTKAFTAAAGANATGILLHDVDVTDGDAGDGALLVGGVVNVDRLDATTAAKITTEVVTALKGKVEFIKNN